MKVSRKILKRLISEVMAEQRVPGESTARSEQAYRRNSPAGTRQPVDKSLGTARRRRDQEEIRWALMDADDDGDLDIVNMGTDKLSRIEKLDSIGSQEMADAKRAVGEKPADQAKYLGISIKDWHNIRQELDDHYEDRHREDQEVDDIPGEDDWYALPKLRPAVSHGDPAISTGPRDIVHARLGEIYKENAMEADLAIWLEKNPEFKLVPPGTEFSGWWGTDVIDGKSWYVDGPEEGPINESKETQMSKGFDRSDIKSWFAQTLYEDFETSKPRKRRSSGILTEGMEDYTLPPLDQDEANRLAQAIVTGINLEFDVNASGPALVDLEEQVQYHMAKHPGLPAILFDIAMSAVGDAMESDGVGPGPNYDSESSADGPLRAELVDIVASEMYNAMDSSSFSSDALRDLVFGMIDANKIDSEDWDMANIDDEEIRDRVIEFEDENADFTGL